ncbi:hypothetical protein [Aeromonas sobria]|uniref:hypothetical protein n=1 Tax=Aeromonas sobria TaxID=646 RepID=UPI0011173D61|nr:hypothetical protein [Aeromonas sobria]
MKNFAPLGILFASLSLPAIANDDIKLSDYLIPQDKLLSTSLNVNRSTPIKLTFDRDSSTYIETSAVIATNLGASDAEKAALSAKTLGSLKVDIGYTGIKLTQNGTIPLINVLGYIDEGFFVEIPKEVPNFYSKMIDSQLQLVIYKNFNAVANYNKNLVLTDCITLDFISQDKQSSATSFCKDVGPSQVIINSRAEMMLDGWRFDFPAFPVQAQQPVQTQKPVQAQKSKFDVVSGYGEHLVWGKLKDGDKNHPGQSSTTMEQGAGYPGLLLDTPLDIRPLLSNLDPQAKENYPALQSGLLNHIQIDLSDQQKQYYKSHYGDHVRIRCNIEFVGRFYTPVYCEALQINAL